MLMKIVNNLNKEGTSDGNEEVTADSNEEGMADGKKTERLLGMKRNG